MTRSSTSSSHGKRPLSGTSSPPRLRMRLSGRQSRRNAPSQVRDAVQRSSTPSFGATRENEDEDEGMNEDDDSQEYFDAHSQVLEHQQIEKDHEYALNLFEEENGTNDDEDESPFRLMDLPPELRLNIYRCCLTRPYNILLSKLPPLPQDCFSLKEEDDVQPPQITSTEAVDSDAEIPMVPDVWREVRAPRARQPRRGGRSLTGSIRNLASRHSRSSRRSTARATNALASDNVTVPASSSHSRVAISRSDWVRANLRRLAAFEDLERHRAATGEPEHRPQNDDPLIVEILRTSKQIYKEARSILYNENLFTLDLDTAQVTLSCLHQRSRMQIRHLELTIPSHGDIIDRFAEVVRLSLRYCWGLKKFVIHMPFVIPGMDDNASRAYTTTVYANAFDILRWLPQACEVVLAGNVCREIAQVVEKNALLRQSLNKNEYARRQLISTEAALSIA